MNEPLTPERTLQHSASQADAEAEREFDELLHAMSQITQQMDARQRRIEHLRAETQSLLAEMQRP